MKLRIAELRKERGLTQQAVADRLDLHLTNYNKMEKHGNGLTVERLYEIADIFECRPAELIERLPERAVRVRGHVQAGAWSESPEWPEAEQFDIALAADDAHQRFPFFAVMVRGNSMDRVYREGDILIVSDFQKRPEDLVAGRRYVVERINPDGLYETTVKTLAKDSDGKLWLIPESKDPRFIDAIAIEAMEGAEIRVVGRVYYSQQREPD